MFMHTVEVDEGIDFSKHISPFNKMDILAPLSHHIQIPISSSLVFKRIGQVCVVVENI